MTQPPVEKMRDIDEDQFANRGNADLAYDVRDIASDISKEMPVSARILREAAKRIETESFRMADALASRAEDGWQMVPKEPTDEMLKEVWGMFMSDNPVRAARSCYLRMLETAPSIGEG